MEEGEERLEWPEDQEVCYEILSPNNCSGSIHNVSPMWLPTHELTKDDTNRHGNMSVEMS